MMLSNALARPIGRLNRCICTPSPTSRLTFSTQPDSIKERLDEQQYATREIEKFEWCFGQGFMSAGGADTTAELVAKLDLQPGARVLDVGCGVGGSAFYMAEQYGADVHGVDLGEHTLSLARERAALARHGSGSGELRSDGGSGGYGSLGGTVKFEFCDVREREFPACSFDVIYSRDVLLHIPYEQKLPVFQKFYEWLKPSGQLLISDYGRDDDADGGGPSEKMQQWMAARQYALLSLTEYEQLITDAGFESRSEVQDRTWDYCRISRAERRRLEDRKEAFIAQYSEEELKALIDVFESKIDMCVDGDRTFQIIHARKAGAADTTDADADADSETAAAAAAAAAKAQYVEGECELREALCAINRAVSERGFVVGTDGNCSVRLPPAAGQETLALIKPSGVPYAELRPEHMVALDYVTGEVRPGQQYMHPSSEWHFHTEIYRRRSDVNAVVHTHSMYAGTLACARQPIPAFHYSVAEVGGEDEVACADYHTYGTPALADAVLDALGEDSGEGAQMAALMANHGAVAVGADLDEAFYYAERVENLSEMYWRSLQVPGGPVCLTAAQMADSRARDRGYGQEPETVASEKKTEAEAETETRNDASGAVGGTAGAVPSTSSLQAMRFQGTSLEVLDQLLLPSTTVYVPIRGVSDACDAILSMRVRGAPLIAMVAAAALAVEAEATGCGGGGSPADWVLRQTQLLRATRPTAVNLFKAMDHMDSIARGFPPNVTGANLASELRVAAEQMLEHDVRDNVAIGEHGADAVLAAGDGDDGRVNVLTICNTGALATAGHGTALGIIRSLHARGALQHCYALETRPYNQGARLTAYELVAEGITGTLLCDSMAAALMRDRRIDAVVVGADRVAANGDTANKVGTYQLALAAREHGVPFFVAAPSSSVDLSTASGESIEVEERPASELVELAGVRLAPDGIGVWNPAFDVTPARLLTGGVVTERGLVPPTSEGGADAGLDMAAFLSRVD